MTETPLHNHPNGESKRLKERAHPPIIDIVSRETDEAGQHSPIPRKGGQEYQSLFWPILLIGIGAVWLLMNLGIIQTIDVGFLLNLWPLILIGIGLDILFARTSRILGALVGLALIGVVIALIILAPVLGWQAQASTGFGDAAFKTSNFGEPLGGADEADIQLDLASYPTYISALSDSGDLITADLQHIGTIRFDVEGTSAKTVHLAEEWSGPFGFMEFVNNPRWDIALSPRLPIALTVDAGSSLAEIDLSDLQISSLEIDGGSGQIDLTLPEESDVFEFVLNAGSGPVRVTVPGDALFSLDADLGSGSTRFELAEGADLQGTIESGSGSVVLSVPDDIGVRIVVNDSGSGRLTFRPDMYQKSSRSTWESENFESADAQVVLEIETASGSFTVQ